MSVSFKDELKVYRGDDFFIKDGICIHQCTLNEICDYSEKKYWSMIYLLTSTGSDMKFQLFDVGIDYTEISDFKLFYSFISKGFTKEQTSILLGDLDLSAFKLISNDETKEIVMYNPETKVTIDEKTYLLMAENIRQIHGLKRNCQIPGNEATKHILIEDAREEYELNKNKKYHSQLKDMISTMVNCEGFKYNLNEVWNMKIGAFLDSVKRVQKIKNANILLQSGYSGFGVDLAKISDKQLNWFGEL